jgi:hypothetical protein
MDETPAFITLAAFARLHRVAKPTVTGWKRRGYLVINSDGMVDVVRSNARLASRPSVHRGGVAKVRPGKPVEGGASELGAPADAPSDPDGWTMHEAKRREMVAAAKLRELELAREAGLVVPIAEVEGVVRGEYSIVRTTLLGMASKLAHRLAAATTPEACGALVDTEVRAALAALTADVAP